jgi:hypothetical protein
MQKFANPEPIFRFLLPAFLFYLAAVYQYDKRYLKSLGKYNVWALVRMALLLFAAFGLFLVIPSEGLRGLFLIAAVLTVALFQILLDSTAENILLNQTLTIAFGLFFSLAAFMQYIPSFGPWYVMAVFASVFLLTRSFYEQVPRPEKTKLIGAVAMGLFASQMFWALSFLPLHFSVLSLLLFNFFYFCLTMNYYHLFHVLNIKKMQFHLLLIAVCSILVVLSTPWSVLGQ